jgi:hypothetical protein
MRQHASAKTSRDTLCSLDEIEQIFVRYKELVPSETFFAALKSMQIRRAQVCVEKGSRAVHNGDQGAAIAAALLAIRSQGKIALSRSWLGLVARIVFNLAMSRVK